MWACYCLQSQTGKTYIGSTIDIDRRLRQHNGEISGGAKATKGCQWKRVCHILGFPDERAALQFEWKWKNVSKKLFGMPPIEKRVNALEIILNSEKTTANSKNFSELDGPLMIFPENENFKNLLKNKNLEYAVVLE